MYKSVTSISKIQFAKKNVYKKMLCCSGVFNNFLNFTVY